MVQEAEKFASEDEAQKKHIEAHNSLSAFVFGLLSQLGDQEGLGGKIDNKRVSWLLSKRPPTGLMGMDKLPALRGEIWR
jgi:endoplasmic reticulum chaperone BiP